MNGPAIPEWARRKGVRPRQPGEPRRVVVVGPCASGKSTLVAALIAAGYAASACSQEHSDVPHLWALTEPDEVVYLSVSLVELRHRRGDPAWSEAIYRRQLARLQSALQGCTIYVDTTGRTAAQVFAFAEWALRESAVVERGRVRDLGTTGRDTP